MTRVPLARLPDGSSPHHFHSSCDPAPSLVIEWTYLDRAIRGSRAACCPLEGCVQRRQFQDGESAQLFFAVCKWAVLHATFSILDSYRSSRFRYFQRIARDKDAGLDKSLVIRAP